MEYTTIRRLLSVAGAILSLASLGSANTITYYIDIFGSGTAQQTPILAANATTVAAGTSANLSIPKLDQTTAPHFPSGYYALQSVTLEIDWKAVGSVRVANFYTSPLTFYNASTLVNLMLSAGGNSVTSPTGVGPLGTQASPLSAPVGTSSFSGGTVTGTNVQSAGNLNFFQGFGTSNFTATVTSSGMNASGTSDDPNSANLFFGGTGTMGGIAVVTYNFSEVLTPEPMTFSMVGGALLGVALIARKRQARKA